MSTLGIGFRLGNTMRGILRILNTMFWCWIALSNVLTPISASADFWTERALMLFQLGPIDSAVSLMLRASLPTILWLFFDRIIRGPARAGAVDHPRTGRRSYGHEASPPLNESGAANASGEASNIMRLRRHLGRTNRRDRSAGSNESTQSPSPGSRP